MKKIAGVVLSLILLGLVVAGGCLGGGGGATSTTSPTHTTGGGSPTGTTESSTTTHPGTTTTSSQTTSTTTSSSETPTTTSSTESPTTTTTQTPTEEAYWEHPWEYAPVTIDGENYTVTYYRALYKVQPNQSSPVYEYVIEKSFEKTKIHVYGTDAMGGKKDLGEKGVYQYVTVITPKNAAAMKDKVTIKVWYKNETGDSFIYPWEMGWTSNMYGGSTNLVGFQVDYMGRTLTFTNPRAFGGSLFPYMEGDNEILSDIGPDLTNLWMGWFTIIQVGIWTAWSDENLAVPQSGTWSDMLGHTWSWSTKPDGTATFSGITFNLVDGQWKYSGSPEGVNLGGKATVAPELFIPLEVEGHFSYIEQGTGQKTTIYGYIKIEDLKLEKVG